MKRFDHSKRYSAKRYQARSFRNPYLQTRRPKRHVWSLKELLVIAGVTAGLVGVIYLFGFASFWNIQTVRVDGLQFMSGKEIVDLANQQLQTHRFLIFSERNRLFFDSKRLTKDLDAKYSFEQLNVNVQGSALVVAVKERVSQILWTTDKQGYYADVHGTIIRALSESENADLAWHGSTQPQIKGVDLYGPYPQIAYLTSLPLISNQDNKSVMPGDKMLTEKGIAGIMAMAQVMQEHGLAIEKFSVEHADSQWAKAQTQAGYDVLFDTLADAATQVGYLTTVLGKDVSDQTKLDYVDVRFGDHVYFKLK